MSKAKEDASQIIMTCDFEIKGQIPKEAFEMFAAAQAQILGLRGYIVQVSEECFKGQLQGEGRVIEAFKQLILAAAEYVAAVKEFIIQNLKAIDEYTYPAFEVKAKGDK
ncbi:GL18816 [Drosophila persimilis]|uniref:Acylphosphatase-1-like n=2 Tax=pseudoobscura subgroup TaxID=32358 RepID=A0A6I8UXD6_DROPS|nr:acylphosphatase-1 [Drosophila persimilis]XP_002132596.2 acylphosphatase-1 [Drosophila pseudoobscura]EDW28688.1 GL18816 [Drosophila persimilis]